MVVTALSAQAARGKGLEDLIVPSAGRGSRELVLRGQGCVGQKARRAKL